MEENVIEKTNITSLIDLIGEVASLNLDEKQSSLLRALLEEDPSIHAMLQSTNQQLSSKRIATIELNGKQIVQTLSAVQLRVHKLESFSAAELGKSLSIYLKHAEIVDKERTIRVYIKPTLPNRFDTMFGLPPEFSDFTGRVDAIDRLRECVSAKPTVITPSEKATQKAHITGTGGIGKTQLANYFSRQMLKENYYQWVVWFTAGTDAVQNIDGLMAVQLHQLAESLGLDPKALGNRLQQRIYEILSKKGKGLVVFDNGLSYESLESYVPKDADVLITARDASVWHSSYLKVPVDIFSEKEAVRYIEKVIVRKKPKLYLEDDAKLLAETLGYYPLALTQAIAYIVATNQAIKSYVESYMEAKSSQEALLDKKPFARDTHQMTLLVTIRLSLDKIADANAKQMIHAASYLAPEAAIDEDLLAHWAPDEFATDEALAALKQYSLIENSSLPEHVRIHQMIQTIVKLEDDKEMQMLWFEQVVKFLKTHYEKEEQPLVDELRKKQCLPHIEELIVRLEEQDGDDAFEEWVADMQYYQGAIYLRLGQTKQAQAAFSSALSGLRKILGDEHPVVTMCESNLGVAMLELGDATGAKAHYESALPRLRRAFGDEHPDVANCEMNLGSAMAQLGDAKGAKAHFESALLFLRKALGDAHPSVARCEMNLGVVMLKLGDAKGAKEHYESALPRLREAYGDAHPDVARCEMNLGFAMLQLGDAKGAKEHFESALPRFRKAYGDAHPDVARCESNLGMAMFHLEDAKGAKEHFERALPVLAKALGERHPTFAMCKRNLGILWLDIDATRAEQYCREAIDIETDFYGADYIETARSRIGLAQALIAQKKLPEALDELKRVRQSFIKHIGEYHPHTMQINQLIALIKSDQMDGPSSADNNNSEPDRQFFRRLPDRFQHERIANDSQEKLTWKRT